MMAASGQFSQEEQLQDARFSSRVASSLLVLASGVMLVEVARWVFEWLRYGEASSVSFTTFWSTPSVGWVGVQKALNFVWQLDIFWIALVILCLSAFFGGIFDETANDLERNIHEQEKLNQ